MLLSWFLSLLFFFFFLNLGSSAITSVAWIPSVSSLSKVVTEKLNKENYTRQLDFNKTFSAEDPFIALVCTDPHHSCCSLIL